MFLCFGGEKNGLIEHFLMGTGNTPVHLSSSRFVQTGYLQQRLLQPAAR
jgi:hypothetical protein